MTPRPRKGVNTSTYTGRFAERLKKLREKAGMSVEELAEKSGIPAQTIYNWEQGRSAASIDRFSQLADAIGVKIRNLLPEK
ncbi:hypothetical protein FACS1894189_6040 [Planctomycetales bacterium]|nr:hypothetical protein FACS1894189_6040 [Planctomycetales bacterium]